MADQESCRDDCRKCCSQEFRPKSFLLDYDRPQDFVRFQCGKPLAYLVWRVVWAVYHVAWIIATGFLTYQWAGSDSSQYVKWFIYLTDWCYLMLTLSTLTDAACVIYINVRRKDIFEGLSTACPWYLKANWVLFNVANTYSIIVSLMYWGLIYTSSDVLTAVNVETHGINTVYVIINFCVTAMPIRVLHFWHAVVFAVVYVLFSLFYQLAGGTDTVGNNYIYSILDWIEKTDSAIMYAVVIAFIATPLIHCLLYGIYRLRLLICCHGNCDPDRNNKNAEVVELEYRDNPSYTVEKDAG